MKKSNNIEQFLIGKYFSPREIECLQKTLENATKRKLPCLDGNSSL